MSFILKIVEDAVGDYVPNVGNRQQFFFGGRCYPVNIAEISRYRLGRGLPDISYADGEENVLESDFPAVFQAVQESFGRSFLPAIKLEQVLFPEVVQVGRGPRQSKAIELVHSRFASQ